MATTTARLGLLLVLAETSLLPGCQDPPPPSLVIVTLDTLRADHLAVYGFGVETGPAFTALAERSLLYERAYAPLSITLPSHVSLFTATHPLSHRVLSNLVGTRDHDPLGASVTTLAEVVRGEGFQTAAFVSAVPLARHTGLAAGFDVYDETESAARAAEETVTRAVAWLDDDVDPDRPWLLWVHLFDAHWPYEPASDWPAGLWPEADLARWRQERDMEAALSPPGLPPVPVGQAQRAYAREIRLQDEAMDRLLDRVAALPGGDRRALVVAGDHGEGLGQHGVPFHGSAWAEQLRIPLVLQVPGQPPGRRSELIAVHDVLPTLATLAPWLPLAGLAPQARLSEETRKLGVLGLDAPYGRNVAAEPRLVLRNERWTLVVSPRSSPELYAAEDITERHDLAAQEPAVVAELTRAAWARAAQLREGDEALHPPGSHPAHPLPRWILTPSQGP